MKKSILIFTVSISLLLAGCAISPGTGADSAPVNVAEEKQAAEEPAGKEASDTVEMTEPDAEPDAVEENEPDAEPEAVEENEPAAEPDAVEDTAKKHTAIVWLGDSLTQGSLGHNNDNLANAPYERLKTKVDIPVEGYGMYGVNTHDIFWVYRDENHLDQKIDNKKIYVFWVGSNDWVVDGVPNTEVAPVIDEIDKFISDGNLTDYVVIGTTSRWKLEDRYIPINQALADHYGVHYMDVIDIINRFGYSEDNTHLSQASYDSIADAVYDKIKALGYL